MWADDLIAAPLGFRYCVLFPRAREAITAWVHATGNKVDLPTNVCAVARDATFGYYNLHKIDDTGMAPGITTQLYGYREEGNGKSELDLDPLGTGFFARPCATSAIVSFGEKKFITVGGAAFVTSEQGLAQEMEARGYLPSALTDYLKIYLAALAMVREKRRDKIALWDRHLGDLLQRIPREQIIPWRVMRLAPSHAARITLISNLRSAGFDVGTNYPPLSGCEPNYFGLHVLNFFISDDYDENRIRAACEIIKHAPRSEPASIVRLR